MPRAGPPTAAHSVQRARRCCCMRRRRRWRWAWWRACTPAAWCWTTGPAGKAPSSTRSKSTRCSARCWRLPWRRRASKCPTRPHCKPCRWHQASGPQPALRPGFTSTPRCWVCASCCRGCCWPRSRRRVRYAALGTSSCHCMSLISSACCAPSRAVRRWCRCCHTVPRRIRPPPCRCKPGCVRRWANRRCCTLPPPPPMARKTSETRQPHYSRPQAPPCACCWWT